MSKTMEDYRRLTEHMTIGQIVDAYCMVSCERDLYKEHYDKLYERAKELIKKIGE